jgi:hypothetical protein
LSLPLSLPLPLSLSLSLSLPLPLSLSLSLLPTLSQYLTAREATTRLCTHLETLSWRERVPVV